MDATHILSEAHRLEIMTAIEEVEKKTSAEIVCAVATESGRYDRAESIVGLLFALVALGATHAAYGGWLLTPGDFSEGTATPLAVQAAAVVVGFLLGNALASYVHVVRRLAVSEREIDEEVNRAAGHAFTAAGVRSTENRTGLLIYVSLFEQRLVIFADEAAERALTEAGIQSLRDTAVQQIRKGKLAETFIETIRRAGDRLEGALPADRQVNREELENHVLVFHPRP